MTSPAQRGDMLVNRVRKNRRRLKGWLRDCAVSCYRLYDRDIPEVPLVIDWYEGRLHVAVVGREAEDFGWLEAAIAQLAEALAVAPSQVYLKRRERQRGAAQYRRVAERGERLAVAEGGYRLWVNLTDYLDTGLFLDHRPTRARVGREAQGKRMLNLFCYTGAFTVYAAGGGARSSVSVDLSARYLDWAADNLTLNRQDAAQHRLVRADVLELLATPPSDPEPFDLAVLDPPTFSNSKRMEQVLDVQRDHRRLLEGTLRLMSPGGVVYFSTNRRGFQLDAGGLPAMVEDITAQAVPPDCPRARHRACFRLVHRP